MNENQMKQATLAPTTKLVASTLAACVTVIVVWGVKEFLHKDVPAEISSAFTMVVSAVVGYFTPPGERDYITRKE